MVKHLLRAIVCFALCALAGTSSAALLGSTVTGELLVGGGGTNYFGPGNGSTGCQNSGGSVSVTIVDPAPEFCYVIGNLDTVTVNITDNMLSFADILNNVTTAPTTYRFTFAPGLVTSVFELSDNVNGGLNFTFANNVLTLLEPQGTGGTATYALIGPAAVPEPGSVALLGLGIVALGVARRRRRR